MAIKIDKGKCIGCGACVSTCSKVFEMDGEDICFHLERQGYHPGEEVYEQD